MTGSSRDEEIVVILSRSRVERYAYFVERASASGEVWSLRNADGWVLAGDPEGKEYVPVWPCAKVAALCATRGWDGAAPAAIALGLWLDRWTPGMAGQGTGVAVFPTPTDGGAAVAPEDLAADLRDAAGGATVSGDR